MKAIANHAFQRTVAHLRSCLIQQNHHHGKTENSQRNNTVDDGRKNGAGRLSIPQPYPFNRRFKMFTSLGKSNSSIITERTKKPIAIKAG